MAGRRKSLVHNGAGVDELVITTQHILGGFILHEHARRRQDFSAEKRLNLACSVPFGIPSLSREATGKGEGVLGVGIKVIGSAPLFSLLRFSLSSASSFHATASLVRITGTKHMLFVL
jgi:hypothetical protein